MKSKIIGIATVIFLLTPLVVTKANTNTYFDTQTDYTFTGITQENFNKLIDNDTTTGHSLPSKTGFTILFNNPITFEGIEFTPTNLIRLDIYSGNTLLGSYITGSTDLSKVAFKDVTKVVVFNTSSSWSQPINEMDFILDRVNSYNEISNLTLTQNKREILIEFDISNVSEGYTGSKIYRNGALIKALDSNTTSYIDTSIDYETTYEYKVTALYSDYETPGISKTGEKPIEEVQEVKVQAKHNRVDLLWKLPQDTEFNHVKIYRRTIAELKEIETASLLDQIFGVNKAYANDEGTEYEPLFETNGTYFNDLTVKPRSEYEYRLSSVTAEGEESPGVYVTAETPEEPEPTIIGGGYTETEEGDYLYKWTEPTEGQVRVFVGGNEYKTVNASDRQILIPKEDMKYIFGKPDVSLIPISPYGKEGTEFNPTNPLKQINLPFGADGLLKTGVSLLWVLGPFVLLAMSFLLVPRFRQTIFNAAAKLKNKRVNV